MSFFNMFVRGGDNSDDDREDGLEQLEEKIDHALRLVNVTQASIDDLSAHSSLPPEVERLVANNQKIEAIKLYREKTGLGLKESKDAIDGAEANPRLPVLLRKMNVLLERLGTEPSAVIPTPSYSNDASDSEDSFGEIEQLVRQGNLIMAIKVYREKTGLGLRESKDAIDELARRLGR